MHPKGYIPSIAYLAFRETTRRDLFGDLIELQSTSERLSGHQKIPSMSFVEPLVLGRTTSSRLRAASVSNSVPRRAFVAEFSRAEIVAWRNRMRAASAP